MYFVAICDDDERIQLRMQRMVEQYCIERDRQDIQVTVYKGSMELLDDLPRMHADVYILDILIDALSGIDIAKTIQKQNQSATILFMSASDQYYKEAFKLQADQYLEKPINRKELFATLDRIFAQKSVACYAAKTQDGFIKIPLDDIISVTSDDHYKVIRTKEQQYQVRSKMSEVRDQLDDRFYPITGSIVINLAYVQRIDKSDIYMDDGAIYPLPRGMYRTLTEATVTKLRQINTLLRQ